MSSSCNPAETTASGHYRVLPRPEELASLEDVAPGSVAMFERVAVIADQFRALREHKDLRAARVLRVAHRVTLVMAILLVGSLVPISHFMWDRGFESTALVLRGVLAMLLIGTLGDAVGRRRQRVRGTG